MTQNSTHGRSRINRMAVFFLSSIVALAIITVFLPAPQTQTDVYAFSVVGSLILIDGFAMTAYFAFRGKRQKLGKIMLVAAVALFVAYYAYTVTIVIGARGDSLAVMQKVSPVGGLLALLFFVHALLQLKEPPGEPDAWAVVRPWFIKKA